MIQKGWTRKTPSPELGERQRGMPVWICAADGPTWEWVSADKNGKFEDEVCLAFVEECVMKYTAGDYFDHERCDLFDYD